MGVQRHFGGNPHKKCKVAIILVLSFSILLGVVLPFLVWLWGLGDQDSQQGELYTPMHMLMSNITK